MKTKLATLMAIVVVTPVLAVLFWPLAWKAYWYNWQIMHDVGDWFDKV